MIHNEDGGATDAPVDPPRRRYSCPNYNTCLSVACALNWDSFTCRGCSGEVNEPICWRAHQSLRRDGVANTLCDLPHLKYLEGFLQTRGNISDCDSPAHNPESGQPGY